MLRWTMCLTSLLACASAQAAVYDAAADFTPATTTNPNGVWSYGYDAAGDGGNYALVAFDVFDNSPSTPNWLKTGNNSFGTPTFSKVQTGPLSPFNSLVLGQVGLHPGPAATQFVNDDAAILRFTAPGNGLYAVNSQFFASGGGETTAWVVLNGSFGSPLAALGSTGSSPSYIVPSLALSVGDTLDFVVGNAGSYFFDTTGVNVSISVVPEPAVWMLWAGGLAALGTFARRRGRQG